MKVATYASLPIVLLLCNLLLVHPAPLLAAVTAQQSADTLVAPKPLADIVQITVGAFHTCALTNQGGVKCWGENSDGQVGHGDTMPHDLPVAVSGLRSGIKAISAGRRHTCGVTTLGSVQCWGGNFSGQLGNGSHVDSALPTDVSGLADDIRSVHAGGAHTCALTNAGGVKCWGFNAIGQLGNGDTVDSSTPVAVTGLAEGVIALSAGYTHTCALTNGGGVKCWGRNISGQLGNGGTAYSTVPVDVAGLTSGVIAISAGYAHTCAVTSSGGVKCWGWNAAGQLGDGNTTYSPLPVDVIGLNSPVVGIAVGADHSCALTSSGAVACWGANDRGQLGNGTLMASGAPVAVNALGDVVTALAAGDQHNCALLNSGVVTCWGNNVDGQLGNGSTASDSSLPVAVQGLASDMRAISTGERHTCALNNSGGVACWGSNGSGQLGDGSVIGKTAPVVVNGLASGAIAIATGAFHTCALTNVGGVKCWGRNSEGQLGDGATTDRLTPVDVGGLSMGVIAISAGAYHSCALTFRSGVYCWGANAVGQLGVGDTAEHKTPTLVSSLQGDVRAISTGAEHSCALTSIGGVYCWGANNRSQLGNGNTTGSHRPVAVSGLASGVIAISAGLWHSCALLASGTVNCWGNNWAGALGDGTTVDSRVPIAVTGLSQAVTAISAGGSHTCVLIAGGESRCWGGNWAGQLGNGWRLDSRTPVAVGAVPNASSMSAGYLHTCAVTNAGGAYCWGDRGYGQLGDGEALRTTPGVVLELPPAIAFAAYLPLILR